MSNFSELTTAQQQVVLTQCKNIMGLPEQALEKDYWVTVVLQLIFDSDLGKHLIFKGGTSLSKNGNLISRFSEDIDLAIDYALFGLDGEPTKKQLKKLRKASSLFVKEKVPEILISQISKYGLQDKLIVSVQPDGEGDGTYPEPRHVYIQYQTVIPSFIEYVKPMIVLEIGARSLMEPINDLRVTSLIEAILPQISTTFIDVTIPTATPGKTFLEKEAIADDALWENIRHHRELFTPIMGVDYKDDIRKHLCLVPSEKYINEWERGLSVYVRVNDLWRKVVF